MTRKYDPVLYRIAREAFARRINPASVHDLIAAVRRNDPEELERAEFWQVETRPGYRFNAFIPDATTSEARSELDRLGDRLRRRARLRDVIKAMRSSDGRVEAF